MTQTRLIVLGDPHIQPRDHSLWQQAIDDLNGLAPHAVLVVGDLTGGAQTGTPAGMQQAVAMLNQLSAPWHTVIGNHDLQAECFDTDEQAIADFLSHVQRDTPWFRTDIGPLTVLGLSNTQWRRNAHCANELVYDDTQLAWAKQQLERLHDRPVFILAHVPPIASGIVTLAELHASVGNAVANQNHVPHRVMDLIRQHPNVLMWFSGHNHLGQHYRDAITMQLGVHFVHAGVVGRHTRDGHRHSRVIDIHDDQLVIRTFDHTRQRLDDRLTHVEPRSPTDLLSYRQRIRGRRMVPRDPATMRQGPDDHLLPGGVRFSFLSDAHLVDTITHCQRRVLEWAVQQSIAAGVDQQILGGDLTHHAQASQAQHFLEYVSPITPFRPIRYLPGNNETAHLPLGDHDRCQFIRRTTRLEDWPGHAFALATTDPSDTRAAMIELADQLPSSGHVLVLAHFPPIAEPDLIDRLNRPGLDISWICGHRHAGQTYQAGPIRVHVCGGLDPVKVRGHHPELILGDWDGRRLNVQRRRVPLDLLMPAGGIRNPIGLAFRGEPDDLLHTAMAYDVTVLQFRAADIPSHTPACRTLKLAAAFRQRFAEGFLSLHLPNPSPQSPSLADMQPLLHWARAMQISDLTIHLPAIPARQLFAGDEQGSFANTTWANRCLDFYQGLAEQAIDMGAQLSLENVYHKQRVMPEQELLGTRPGHLLGMVKAIRQRLIDKGCSPSRAAGVGVIFDTGHAFRDPVCAKVHGLGDWIMQLAPCMQLAHIHQTRLVEDRLVNHLAIDDACGPRINYTGVLPMLQEQVPARVPLLLEVRNRDAALTSLRTLRAMIAQGEPSPGQLLGIEAGALAGVTQESET